MAALPFHPLLGILIAILILSGTILFGQEVLKRLDQKKSVLVSLALGMVLISQALYICSLDKIMFTILYPTAWCLMLLGAWYNFSYLRIVVPKCYTWRNRILNIIQDPVYSFSFLLMFGFILLSFSPPTNADALNYHWGIPVYLLRNHEWPSTGLWLHGSLGGIGEIYNTLGVSLYAENLGTILQSLSLILFSCYLANRYKGNKRIFLHLYILSSPVLLFLVTAPKPQLFPAVLTALALYITISEKNINKQRFFLITCLLMGAAQQKISFNLTGSIIGMVAFWKALRNTKLTLAIVLMCFLFFYLPRGIWNLGQSSNLGLTSFISPLPVEFLDGLQKYRENNFWFPFNLFFPQSLGTVSSILGFQILFLVFVRTKNKKFWAVMVITTSGIVATYFLGQSVARSFYEFVLWTAVAFSFLPQEEFNFRIFTRLLLIQGLGVFVTVLFGIFVLFPGALSGNWRKEVMLRSASEYSAVEWVNQVIPENAVVISGLRSVSLLSHEFIPTDWLSLSGVKKKYFDTIKLKNPNFLLVRGENLKDLAWGACAGEIYAGPKSFKVATRNPYNSGLTYHVTIYHFNSSLLPQCQ
jgi:hypothetical protein